MAKESDFQAELQKKYGCRPRNYRALFNSSCEAEWRFVDSLPAVAGFLNKVLESKDLIVHECELAVNFISEGGYMVLDSGQVDYIDGFGSLGIDTLVDNYKALKPYLHPMVQRLVEGGENHSQQVNERGENVTSLTNLTIEEGIYANAGMYAWSKVMAADHIKTATKKQLKDQDIYTQFYWSTVYYNAGPGTGLKQLQTHGLARVKQPWDKADDQQFNRNPHYNASWRTSSFEYLLRTVYAKGSPSAWTPAPRDGYLLYGVVNLNSSPTAGYSLGLIAGHVAAPASPPANSITTGKDGRYELESAKPGPQTLVISQNGQVLVSQQLELSEKTQAHYIELSHHLQQMMLGGNIYDAQGTGVEGLKLALCAKDGTKEAETVTQPGGQFSLATLVPGAKKLLIEAPGGKEELTVQVDQQYVTLEYTLGTGTLASIKGLITLDGKPVESTWVDLTSGSTTVSASTDPAGSYSLLTSAQGQAVITVYLNGGTSASKKITLTAGEQSVDFDLPGITIKGTVSVTGGDALDLYLECGGSNIYSQRAYLSSQGQYEFVFPGEIHDGYIQVFHSSGLIESVALGTVTSSITKDFSVSVTTATTE